MRPGLEQTANGAFYHPDDPGEPGYGEVRQRWSLVPYEAAMLETLARGHTVLEIGTGLGHSTTAMASTAVSVMTVDIDEWVERTIVPHLPENVRFFKDRSDIPADARWSLAFIDGLHDEDAVAADIAFAAERLIRPGLIVLHDANLEPVQSGIAKALKPNGLSDAYGLPTQCGMALVFACGDPT